MKGGFDSARADQLTWRFSQIGAVRPSSWWQAPLVEHAQLDKLSQLQADLQEEYRQQLNEGRDTLQRQLHRWNQMLAQAQNAGITADGLDTTARFTNAAARSTTPNEVMAHATVLAEQVNLLDARVATL